MVNSHLFLILITCGLLLTACTQNEQQGGEHNQHNQPQPTEDHNQHNQPSGGHESTNTPQVQALWNLSSQKPEPNKDTDIAIQIQDNTGKPIENFEISHEKKMHLIVVSKDLSFFNHIHPEYKEKGKFEITTQFPTGGDYKLISDFIPAGGSAKTESQWITVKGDIPKQSPLQPETKLTKVVEGTHVTLSIDQLQAGKEITMTFNFRDAKSGQPVTNLQPYLGAAGHVVILSANAEKYIHNHPLEEKATGPDAKFGTSFPTSGVYKLWGQFQREGKVFVVPFVVNVP